MFAKIKSVILKSYFLSLITALIIIVFLPSMFSKYEIKLVEKGKIRPTLDAIVYHSDIDNDGNSERIVSFSNGMGGMHAIQIFTPDGGTIDQWNFDGTIINIQSERLITGDYDKDNSLEVYVFYLIEDTIFLDCFEPLDLVDPFEFKRIKIIELSREFYNPDCIINGFYFQDINGDGYEEVIIKANSRRAKFPREIYVYDIKNDTVYHSPKIGANLINLQIFDLDGDGKSEIFGSMNASGNIHDSLRIPYNDYSAWIIAFDDQFNLLFEPVEYPGFRSCISILPVYDTLMAIYYQHLGPGKNYPELMLMNIKGEILKKLQFSSSSKVYKSLYINQFSDKIIYWIIQDNGKLLSYDEDFNFIKAVDLNTQIKNCIDIDLDGDLLPEQIMASPMGDLLIAKDNFRYITKYKFEKDVNLSGYSIIQRLNIPNILYMQYGSEYYKIQFRKNPLAPFQYLVYLGVFLLIWFFILIVQKLYLIRIEKNNRIRREIVNLQLKNLKSQMDPHFTFNVFNTIASLIKKESSSAYQPFLKFSNLIRYNLETSDKIIRTIEDEITYLKNYLDLESLRFSTKFDYNIDISEDVDIQTMVPKMLLQTYVENAIKHGLMHKKIKGLLNIRIRKSRNYLEFIITDNGIGRQKAMEISKNSTGFGLKIMNNYFKLFNEFNKRKIKQKIIDLYDEDGKPIGTEIVISIPNNFNYKLRKI